MAECAFCKSETQLHESGTPVCVRCAEARDADSVPAHVPLLTNDAQVREILRQEVLTTTAVLSAASDEFNSIMGDIPSAVPQPDGNLRIHQASRKLSDARKEMIRAHSRLNDYLSRGVVPEELKRTASDPV